MTPDEAREAIAGTRRVIVFFTDRPLARRLARTSDPKLTISVAANKGEQWTYRGEPEHLPLGSYNLPLIDGSYQPTVVFNLAQLAGISPPRGLGMQLLVVETEGVRYQLCTRTDGRSFTGYVLPDSATLMLDTVTETPRERRQRERYEMCIKAGLKMPDNPAATLPRGIGEVAKNCGISRPTFTQDVKQHIQRLLKR